jgi:hypothetical protein
LDGSTSLPGLKEYERFDCALQLRGRVRVLLEGKRQPLLPPGR